MTIDIWVANHFLLKFWSLSSYHCCCGQVSCRSHLWVFICDHSPPPPRPTLTLDTFRIFVVFWYFMILWYDTVFFPIHFAMFFYLSFLDIFLNYFLSVSFFLFLSMSFPLSLPMFVSLFFLLSIRPCLSLSSPTPLSILSHLNCWYSAVGLLELVLQICHLLQLTFHPLHFWPNS